MARVKVNYVVLDPGSGKARPGAWVTFYTANTLTKAALYADDGISAVSNPVQANGLGQVAVRVDPGLYDISMTWDGAQPTVVEDVLAWVPEGAIISEPGDLIVGDSAGNAARLPLAPMTDPSAVLMAKDNTARWWQIGPTTGLPAGAPGSLYTIAPNTLALQVVPPGLQDQALAMAGGQPTWVSTLLPPGTTLPISQPGDLVVGAVGSGVPTRLARGTPDQFLATDSTGGLVWRDALNLQGSCALVKDGANLKLIPHLGNGLWVNGRTQTIPGGGVTLAPTGLSADTTYSIYAAMTPSMTLEASTTGHELTGGVYHKTGDLTRSLVGMARVVSGPAWEDSLKRRLILSLFSTMPRPAVSWFTAPRSTNSTSGVELHSEIRIEWLSWANTPVTVNLSGMMWVPGPPPGPTTINTSIVLDGGGLIGHIAEPSATGYINASMSTVVEPTAGYHYLTLHGSVGPADTTGASWNGDPSGTYATRLHAMIPQ